MKYITNKKHSS